MTFASIKQAEQMQKTLNTSLPPSKYTEAKQAEKMIAKLNSSMQSSRYSEPLVFGKQEVRHHEEQKSMVNANTTSNQRINISIRK